MGATSEERSLRAGDIVAGVFRVEALLGRGGAGAVYRVRDARSGRKLALKQLLPPDDDRRALVTSHFEREFYTLSQLAHPRIIEVYDYGLDQDFAYYTMELLDGEDLHERGKLTWRKACAILCDVASSLAIVHARGLVHRDVSARNVRCTSDERAKLIDFGAMAPIGVSHRLVGTPPFVPPEALQLQALDGRADLFALGALAYWTLTGRYAYPASTFNQLRDLWRTAVPTPRQYQPELPPALAELVLQLLQLERGERPSSAAEVMERLSGIAGLQLQELPQVGRAYLVMPTLVARDHALRQVRGALLQSMQSSRGAALLIEGEAGSGRSRFLDACVLEAKLIGAVVLRGDQADRSPGPYAMARALGRQLLQNAPGLAHQSALPRVSLLSHVLPELAPPGELGKLAPERRHLQAALRDWVLTVARAKHVVIAVDDVGAVDEPSAAWLGALAHGAQRRQLSLLLTARRDLDGAVVRLLREVAISIEMEPLSAAQTEELLRSLFGDAERLVQLAERVQSVARGNPRNTMALIEHMVARGSLRYEAGSWTLPLELRSAELPASDGDAVQRRLAALSADARTLVEALALTDPSALSLPDYAVLGGQQDPRRTFRALDELVAAGILISEGEQYGVTRPGALEHVRASLDGERLRVLHARIATALQSHPEASLELSHHLLLGGREHEAIERLLSTPIDAHHPRMCEVLECAVLAAERLQLPVRSRLELHRLLVHFAALMGHNALFMQYGLPLIDRLEHDSGLRDSLEFAPAVNSEAPVAAALARAQQRHDSLPEALRGLSPKESLPALLMHYVGCVTMAALTQRLELVERVLPLEAWFGVHPWVALVHDAVGMQRALQSGRHHLFLGHFTALMGGLAQLSSSDRGHPYIKLLRFGNVYTRGLGSAVHALPSTHETIAELESQPGFRSNAWRVRMVYELALGNLELARDGRRRAELLDLQDGAQVFPDSTLRVELLVYIATEDLLGVKRSMERIQALAAAYPGWRPTLSIAHGHYRRLQGDPAGGLEVLLAAIDTVQPGRHMDWSVAGEARLLLLRDLGRHAEAAALGLDLLAVCSQYELWSEAHRLKLATAEVLAQVGQLELATRLISEYLALQEKALIRGVMSGLAHETRARIAIAARDESALLRHAELCAREYSAAPNANLSARYERLMRAAAAAGMVLNQLPEQQAEDQAAHDAARTVYSRMLTCVSPAERSEQALQLLLEATGARTGHLFGLRSGRLHWLSSGDQSEAPRALEHTLEDYWKRQLDNETEAGPTLDFRPAPLETFIDDQGREFEPLLLRGKHQGEAMIAGVAALHYDEDDRPEPRKAMLHALVAALISGDVVDPITCVA
jgi:hypothetical protein